MNHVASSHPTDPRDNAAVALKGASLAFRRGPDKDIEASTPATLTNGSRSSPPVVKRAAANESSTFYHQNHQGHTHDVEYTVHQARHSPNVNAALRPPILSQRLDPKSPSFIAATLAASRSVSPGLLTSDRRPAASLSSSSIDAVDSESIAPTSNLISMFETSRDLQPPRKGSIPSSRQTIEQKWPAPIPKPASRAGLSPRPPTPPIVAGEEQSKTVSPTRPPTPPIRISKSAEKIFAMPMPKPQQFAAVASRHPTHSSSARVPPRAQSLLAAPRTDRAVSSRNAVKAAGDAVTKPLKGVSLGPPSVIRRSAPEVLSPKPLRLIKPPLAPSPSYSSSPGSDFVVNQKEASLLLPPPPPSKPQSKRLITVRSSSRSQHRANAEDRSTLTTPLTEFGLPKVTSISAQPSSRQTRHKLTPSPPHLPHSREMIASAPTSPELGPMRPSRGSAATSTSNLPLNTLTNAMMASSLANLRLTPHNSGSSLPPPSLAKRQKSPRLLHTLRQPQSQSEQDPERFKIAHRHKLSSNKHAHHEGSRKRWRDQITQRERKRYEAVWASNRGFLLQSDANSDALAIELHLTQSECVANVVVREIWKRSRLPTDELMEVWELVDRGNVGMLTRQDFVVGMWLIDQRLKGRKLPVRVSDSVWDSANGVRVLKPRPKARSR